MDKLINELPEPEPIDRASALYICQHALAPYVGGKEAYYSIVKDLEILEQIRRGK